MIQSVELMVLDLRGDKEIGIIMETKKTTVHVKFVFKGKIIKIPNQQNSYCWHPYKDKWVSVNSLNRFEGGDNRIPFLTEAKSKVKFLDLFNRGLIDEIYCIFVGYNDLCGVLLISDTLFVGGTTKEIWEY